MNRLALCAVAAILASSLACGVGEPLNVTDTIYTIKVSKDAMVDSTNEIISIPKGVTEVQWVGADGMKTLWIVFTGTNSKILEDPDCLKTTCIFSKEKSNVPGAENEPYFKYHIAVKGTDGTVTHKDPRLIIRP